MALHFPTMIRAALYLRSSKDRADASIDAQRRELQALAAAREMVVIEEFADPVERADDGERPGFQAMLRRLKDRERNWSTLLVMDTSRIARQNQYLAAAFNFAVGSGKEIAPLLAQLAPLAGHDFGATQSAMPQEMFEDSGAEGA